MFELQEGVKKKSSHHELTEKDWVSFDHAASIFSVSWSVVRRMAAIGYLDTVQIREHGPLKICYQSIVKYCDELRDQYRIADRRPTMSGNLLRHKDRDLLPFPMDDTLFVADAVLVLGCSQTTFRKLCDEGRFECYRLTPDFPWRIYRPSFEQYVGKVMEGVRGGPHAYRSTEL